MADLTRSRKLSKFVKDFHTQKWKQLQRTIPPPRPTPVIKTFNPSEYVDTRVVDFSKMTALLAEVGINTLPGVPFGSPIQRLHIASSIGELNKLEIDKLPNISNLQDLALLSAAQRTRIRRAARSRRDPDPGRPSGRRSVAAHERFVPSSSSSTSSMALGILARGSIEPADSFGLLTEPRSSRPRGPGSRRSSRIRSASVSSAGSQGI